MPIFDHEWKRNQPFVYQNSLKTVWNIIIMEEPTYKKLVFHVHFIVS